MEAGSGVLRPPTYKELLHDNRQLREELRVAQQRITKLERQAEELLRLAEMLRVEGKRQAAPFRMQDQPTAEPKKPGRKSDKRQGPHAQSSLPPRIDETYEVPQPMACPRCDGRHLSESRVATQYQTENPRKVI